MRKNLFFFLFVLLGFFNSFGQPLTEGVDITLRNTLQDPGEQEVTYSGLFGLADNAFDEFATLSNSTSEFATALAQVGTPFGDISGLYDIDFTESSIEFTALPDETDPFWVNVFGLFPEGKFDRYYFTFSEPHNITSVASNHTSVDVRIDSETIIVVEISEGYDLKPGAGFFISLNMAEELTNEEKARAFNEGLQTGDLSVLNWMRNDYIQHNLTQPTGKENLIAFYNPNFGTQVDIVRSFEAGDYVFAQSLITFGGFPSVFYDVWRFEDGMAVEHWDNSVPLTDDMDGTTQIDGVVTPVTDLASTAANQALLEEMSQTLFVDGDWTNVRDYFDLDNYVQHSVGAGPDGAFLASLEGQTGVSFYDDVKFVHTSGNFGLVMSQGPDITGQDPEGDYAYYDLFRMENGKIVEHWDAITKIEDRETWANNNGKWGDDVAPNEGTDIVLRNTLQDPGEPEVPYSGLFGLADDAFDEFATLSNTEIEFATALAQTGTPFGDISGLYEIDLTENSIEFKALPDENDPFWVNVFGLFPEGKFDRYYFTFSEPHNIVSAASNHTSVDVRIDSDTEIVVEISEGYDLKPGAGFFISLNMAEELTNEQKARGFNEGLLTGDPSAIKWMRNDYLQHNLTLPTGRDAIAAFYPGFPFGITVDIHRSFQAGDFVMTQTTFGGAFSGGGPDQLIIDVWRFEDGFAVEHWDNITDVVDDMDGTTQTDGVATPVTDLDQTDANNALLEEMSQTLFVDGDWTNVRNYFDIDNYVQHSVGAGPDGAFLASLEGQTGVPFYDDVKFVHTSGNFGLVMSQGPDITGQDPEGVYAYYDLFRIENGLIVEHWDIIEEIPARDQWANNNGKWGDDVAPNEGTDIVLRNTLQDPGEPEVPYSGLFGLADDAFDEFATLSNTEIEFPTALAQTGTPFGDISGLYEIDLTENSIEFKALPDENDPFWVNVFGLFPEGKFDRYYFTFSEPHNITSASSNHTSVDVRIDSETIIVVEISEGYDLKPGAGFFITLNRAEELSNEEKARAFNTGLTDGDASVIKWIRNDYIQHNLGVPDGKEPIAGFYGGEPTGITVDVHRSFEIGDFVFAQTTLGGTWGQFFGSGTDNILYEVWRFEDGFAVEHWDNIVAVIDDMDGTTQTDGAPTPATDLESTDANKALLEEMAQMLFVNGDWTNVRDYFDLDNYVQHSVGAGPDGAFLASLEGQTGVAFYDDVKFIHVLGNFGLVMSQGPDITGQDLDNPYAYYDLFRMENGKIVEHWDAIQMIPPQDQWAHNNGKWGDDAIEEDVVDITLRNTLEEDGTEVTYASLFGLADDAFDEFAVLSNTEIEFATALAQSGTPFGDINGLYEIDLMDSSIEFTLLPDETDPFWTMQFGVFPAGKVDRYYLTYSEPHNITSFSSSNSSVNLRIDSENVIVVELSEGYDFNPGMAFTIDLNPSVSNGVDLNLSLEAVNQLYDQYTEVDYVLTVTNEGDAMATNIEVEAALPDELAYTSHNTTKGDFVQFLGEWTIPSLAAGEAAVLNLTLFTLVENQEITYFSQIVALDQLDVDSTPDSSGGEVTEDDEAAVTIFPKSNGGFGTNSGNNDLELSIATDGDTYDKYEVVRYTISVTNNGAEPATGIEVAAGLPDGMAYTDHSTSNGEYILYFEEWRIDFLEAGQTAVLELDLFTLVDNQPITNFVQILVANELDPDSTPGNNTSGIPSEDDEAALTIEYAERENSLSEEEIEALLKRLDIEIPTIDKLDTGADAINISLSPNPFKSVTNFEIQIAISGKYQLQVFDITGKEVSRQIIELIEGTNRIPFDGSQLNNGVYSYRVSNTHGFVSGKMLVVD